MKEPNDLVATAEPILIEKHSTDYIPESERHGNLFSQFTLWLSANLQITAVITGALAVVLGGDVFWSLIGLTLGQLVGAPIMALHGSQGPKLGLPQMISSRVQFGVHGAVIPLALVCVMYVGLNAGGTILAGQALSALLNIDNVTGILIFAGSVVFLTTLGYRAIHMLGRVSSIIGVVAFLYLFISLLHSQDIITLLDNRHFSLSSFLLAVSLSASWQISYGPYVADYSRYLPSAISPRKTFWAICLGSMLGSEISMVFGVFAAALAGNSFSGHEVSFIVGLGATGTIAGLLYFTIALGKLPITTLNAYGSVMAVATMLTGIGGRRTVSNTARVFFILLMVGLSTTIALVGVHSFLKQFSTFILFLLAFVTPWSAINLVDYYLITKGRYDASALFDPEGIYGRWNFVGISVYVLGVLVQIPFISTPLYTGGLVAYLHEVDISWIVGLVVPSIAYFYLARSKRASRLLSQDLELSGQ